MEIVFFVVAYLLIGWVITYWFRNSYLDNGRWNDGQPFSLGSAIMMNIGWPSWAMIILAYICVEFIPESFSRVFKKIYGIK